MYKIMIVEDDLPIAKQLEQLLQSWGYNTYRACSFTDIDAQFTAARADLVLMDLMLPERNGFFWTKKIRETSPVPVIFISSADEPLHIVTALSSGADDYVTKPFDTTVLVTKVQALLRRFYEYGISSDIMMCGEVRLDCTGQEVHYTGKSTDLSRNETRILKILFAHKDQVVSRDLLMEQLWKTDLYIDANTLSVNINRLRKKLASIGITDLIQTKKGAGYCVCSKTE
jgi:DNA-binding response OmpR family regulator